MHPKVSKGRSESPLVAREGETPPCRQDLAIKDNLCNGTKKSPLREGTPPSGGGGACGRYGNDFLQGVALVGCSFSSLRKNQRGPEGVSQFIPPGDTPSGLPPFPLSCEGYWVELPSSASQGRPVSGSLRWSPCAATVRRTPELSWSFLSDSCCSVLQVQPGAFRSPPGPLRSPLR